MCGPQYFDGQIDDGHVATFCVRCIFAYALSEVYQSQSVEHSQGQPAQHWQLTAFKPCITQAQLVCRGVVSVCKRKHNFQNQKCKQCKFTGASSASSLVQAVQVHWCKQCKVTGAIRARSPVNLIKSAKCTLSLLVDSGIFCYLLTLNLATWILGNCLPNLYKCKAPTWAICGEGMEQSETAVGLRRWSWRLVVWRTRASSCWSGPGWRPLQRSSPKSSRRYRQQRRAMGTWKDNTDMLMSTWRDNEDMQWIPQRQQKHVTDTAQTDLCADFGVVHLPVME